MSNKIKFTFLAYLYFSFFITSLCASSYKVAVGDVLEVSIHNEPALSSVLQVDKDGMINLAFIGDVMVKGKTLIEMEDIISQRYFDDGILKQAFTTVTIQSYAVKYFYIFGEINSPGMKAFPDARNHLDIIEVISYAGDFKAMAQKGSLRIVRKRKDGSEFILKMDVRDIFTAEKARTAKELIRYRIMPGDLIYVPERFI